MYFNIIALPGENNIGNSELNLQILHEMQYTEMLPKSRINLAFL